MNHPAIHVLAIIAAILIPGAEVLYFAWVLRQRHNAKLAETAKDKDPIEDIRNAFLEMYPVESLRVRARRERLEEARRRRRRKFYK